MLKFSSAVFAALMTVTAIPAYAGTTDMNTLFMALQGEISGNRARDYTMRIWVHDKWSTLPEWNKSAAEAEIIMKERGFDETKLDGTPADGITRNGGWTNTVGWDCKQATLEVIEPSLPVEFRYLANYQDNPTSLNNWSAPTPPEGIETELVLWEGSNPEELAKLNARGKIVLTGMYTRGIKRYLTPNGILGYVSDTIEGNNVDFINANQWLNGWTDKPGWWFTGYDSKNDFSFSIYSKKADRLKDILRRGGKVRVRAKIDSRYYTDGKVPFVTGVVKGSGPEGEEVLITGHINEWGANDNASGVAAIIEAVGTLNDLIKSGKLPRPKRSIRALFGAEMYGSMPYVMKNYLQMHDKTIAAVCCDTPTEDYDAASTAVSICMNPNVCPSYTDAVFPEIVRLYYDRYNRNRVCKTEPFQMGTDTYFCEPMIGAPTNYIGMDNGSHLHHNSMDTIEKVDPRTVRELAFLNAAYLYFIADADFTNLPWIAKLTFERGISVIMDKAKMANARIPDSGDGAAFGKFLADQSEILDYYTNQQKLALAGIERLITADKKAAAHAILAKYEQNTDEIGKLVLKQFQGAVNEKALALAVKIVPPVRQETAWEKEASTIIPKRYYPGTLFFVEIPMNEWKEVSSPPVFWSAGNWAASSYWWVDGKRNLVEIKKLCEIEAGRPMGNFNLINYYTFLKDHKYVEFVPPQKTAPEKKGKK
jgi:hypothetical protein